ncbi:glutathione S-transferase family protein [Vibrio palustris]|uniref:glutathione transferase n=1 Tax=Vibrio palustris TaxID=1918946 RepID=A0A1R4B5W4_9VIBR|nr:glutathione S-transferase family protein [Vibrio palustris]SJL84318.1 Disulfide-bond oxidoreductase YfcG [Vibrio palustris]
MITLHHLNQSRSKRIIWLLEELSLDYRIHAYQRDAVTNLAPPELKEIHPLGKSPVIEDNGQVITESGAITEYLIERHGLHLMPAKESASYAEYLQWLHFAESSAMLPALLTLFVSKEPVNTEFLASYAGAELTKVMSYFDDVLSDKTYLIDEQLSGADIMMSFIPEVLAMLQQLETYPNIKRYYQTLLTHPAFQKANELEKAHQTA